MPPRLRFPVRSDRPLAIVNVTLVPMGTERVLPAHTVIVEAGFIRTAGPSAVVDVAGMQVVDGAGGYLLPGLADMHVHVSSPTDVVLFLAHGVTTVRNMAGAPFHLALQRQVARGELPGPRIICASPIVDGPGPASHVFQRLTDPAAAPSLVRGFAQRGYQQLKVYNELHPTVLHALARAGQEHGMPVVGHCPNAMTFEEAIAGGMRCFEHLTGIWRGHLLGGVDQTLGVHNLDIDLVRATAHDLDFDAIRRLAGRMAAAAVWNCPTLVAMQRMHEPQATGSIDPDVEPWLKYVPAMAIDFWSMLDRRLEERLAARGEWLSAMHARNDAFLRVVAILHEEGAPLVLGTDTAVRFVVPGLSLHQELANFVAAGLSPYQALRCGTVDAARSVGEGDQWGTIAVGKQADMVLVRANPLDDVRALDEPEAVFVNGYYLPRPEIDGLLVQAERIAALRPPESLPDIDLDAIDDGSVVREGMLVERIVGREVGRLRYRHRVLPDGSRLVEERHAFDRTGDLFTMAGGRRRTARLLLSPDYELRRADAVVESFAGREKCEVHWLDGGGYEVRVREIDGVETRSTVPTGPLFAGDHLSITAVPAWLADREERVAQADVPRLDVPPDVPTPSATVSIVEEEHPAESGTGRVFRMSAGTAGDEPGRTVWASRNGGLLRMTQGHTELTAADEASATHA